MTNVNVQESQRPHSVISVDSSQSLSGDGEIIDQYSSGSKVCGYPTETQAGNGKTQNFSENPYQLGMPLQSRPILKNHNEDSLSSKDTEINSQRQCFLGRGHKITTTVNNNEQKELNIVSFNCKNVKTCASLFQDTFMNSDIILLQEHWLFSCELHY